MWLNLVWDALRAPRPFVRCVEIEERWDGSVTAHCCYDWGRSGCKFLRVRPGGRLRSSRLQSFDLGRAEWVPSLRWRKCTL